MESEMLHLVVLFALLSSHGALGKFSFIPEQKQKETIHRPVIKTIRRSDGDIFDCVDIYQQPAFDHPLLKNHKIQMRPSSFPVDVNSSSSTSSGASWSSIVLDSLDCPPRTIPILRAVGVKNVTSTSHSTLRRAGSLFHVAGHTSNDPSARGYLAQYLTGGYFYGVKAAMAVYQPTLVKGNIVSEASINLSNGKGDQYSAATAGWFVYPDLYDSHTRLFVSSYNAKQPPSVCINLLCPGFVQVSRTIALGSKILPLSQYGGPQYRVDLQIFKDPARGDWWVAFGREMTPLGYWPKEVFTSLGNQASIAFWGGYAESRADVPSPPMGSGHFGYEGFGKAAVVLGMQVVNRNHNLIAPLRVNCRKNFYTPNCYKPEDLRESSDESWGLNFYFGGPGGCVGESAMFYMSSLKAPYFISTIE